MRTKVNKFAISNHVALKLDVQALRSYLSLICEYKLYILPNKKVSASKDHGKNYMEDGPPLVRHLLRRVCSINFEPPDNDLCSACHGHPLFRGAWII